MAYRPVATLSCSAEPRPSPVPRWARLDARRLPLSRAARSAVRHRVLASPAPPSAVLSRHVHRAAGSSFARSSAREPDLASRRHVTRDATNPRSTVVCGARRTGFRTTLVLRWRYLECRATLQRLSFSVGQRSAAGLAPRFSIISFPSSSSLRLREWGRYLTIIRTEALRRA